MLQKHMEVFDLTKIQETHNSAVLFLQFTSIQIWKKSSDVYNNEWMN